MVAQRDGLIGRYARTDKLHHCQTLDRVIWPAFIKAVRGGLLEYKCLPTSLFGHPARCQSQSLEVRMTAVPAGCFQGRDR